jgi:hypothetical protein
LVISFGDIKTFHRYNIPYGHHTAGDQMTKAELKELLDSMEGVLSDHGVVAYGIVLAVPNAENDITVVGRAATRMEENSTESANTHGSMRKVIVQSLEELAEPVKKPVYLN